MFQSLKGFWGGYSDARFHHVMLSRGVSIPERVLGWLQLLIEKG